MWKAHGKHWFGLLFRTQNDIQLFSANKKQLFFIMLFIIVSVCTMKATRNWSQIPCMRKHTRSKKSDSESDYHWESCFCFYFFLQNTTCPSSYFFIVHIYKIALNHNLYSPFNSSFQSVWKAWRSMGSVTWLTPWGSAITPPVKTVMPWAVSSVRPHPAMRTTNWETTSANALARMSRSGWALTTWWLKASGRTRPASASRTKTGTHPILGPLSQMVASPRTVPSCPGPLVGSGLTRTVVRRGLLSASSTLFDPVYPIIDSEHG